MQTLSEIRELLAEQGVRPKHRLGQNFLHDQNQLRKLITASGVAAGDLVLEVGPGTGTLTEALLEAGATVIACELDGDMASILERRLSSRPGCEARFRLVRGDALAHARLLNPRIVEALAGRCFRLVANLPYQIASPLISTLLIDHPECTGQFVTIQKEVADRLTAVPSTKAYGSLSVIVQALAKVSRISTLSPSCFWPEPQVISAMISITPRPGRSGLASADGRAFAVFVTGLFSKRRKQLGSIIGRSNPAWAHLHENGIRPDMRPEALNVQQIVALWRESATSPPLE